MNRRLAGAALLSKVDREMRRELSEDYGLPMHEYRTADIFTSYTGYNNTPGYRGEPPDISIIYKRRTNGRKLQVTGILPNNDGTIDIRSADVEMR